MPRKQRPLGSRQEETQELTLHGDSSATAVRDHLRSLAFWGWSASQMFELSNIRAAQVSSGGVRAEFFALWNVGQADLDTLAEIRQTAFAPWAMRGPGLNSEPDSGWRLV